MNFWERIINALNPCVHMWDVTEKLVDDKDDPRHIKLIKTCSVCGQTKVEEFQAPPKMSCPPHKWVNKQRVSVFGPKPQLVNNKPTPIRYDYEQQCERCGDLRVVRL